MQESARKQYYYRKKKIDKIEQQLSNINLFQEKIEKTKRHTILN